MAALFAKRDLNIFPSVETKTERISGKGRKWSPCDLVSKCFLTFVKNQSKPWSPGKTAFGQLLVLARCAQCPVVFAQTVWILLSSALILEHPGIFPNPVTFHLCRQPSTERGWREVGEASEDSFSHKIWKFRSKSLQIFHFFHGRSESRIVTTIVLFEYSLRRLLFLYKLFLDEFPLFACDFELKCEIKLFL